MALDRLITEAGEYLITEAGEYLILEEAIGVDALASATLSGSLNTRVNVVSSTIAVANLSSADLATTIRLASQFSAQASETASLSTTIKLGSSLSGSPALSASLNTSINAVSSAIAVASLSSASLTTTIRLSSSPVGSGSVSASLTNGIRLSAALSSSPSITYAKVETPILISGSCVASSSISANLYVQYAFAASVSGSASSSGSLTNGIRLASNLSALPAVMPSLNTSINVVAASVSVSNLTSANLTATIALDTDLAGSSAASASMTSGILLNSSLYGFSSAQGVLNTSINAVSSAIAVANLSNASLTTKITPAASVSGSASVFPSLTNGIRLASALASSSTSYGSLYTSITPIAATIAVSNLTNAAIETAITPSSLLVGSPSVSPSLQTQIRVSSSLAGVAAITSNLATSITAVSSATSQAASAGSLTTGIRPAASLAGTASFAATLNTKINAVSALVGVSNLTKADLYVTRLYPHFDSLGSAIYLAEIQAYDPGSSSVTTWRFASGRGYDNAGTFYEPRIEQPATLVRTMGGSSVGGKTNMSYGELTLINNDGALNALADDFFDGRTLTLKRGRSDQPYASFATVMVATVETVAIEREIVSIRLRDRAVSLDTAFSTAKYAGTNVLPNGIEGTADDLIGQSKPRIFGRIALMQPKLVNTSKLIYQVNNGAVDSVVNVFDAGAYLSRDTNNYSSQADMEANAPASGTYRVWPAGGCFRLGSSPYGQVTACVAENWDYTQSNAAGILQRILSEKGFTSSDWVAADFTALSQKNAATLGVVVKDEETTSSLVNRICQSIGAWWGFDTLGRFRVARLDAPSGTATATLTDTEILELERKPEDAMPLWQTTVKADMNYAVQTATSLAGIVSDNRVTWLALESRDQQVSNSSVKTMRLLAEDQTYDSLINGISQAQAESTRRLNLFSVRRDSVTVTLADPANYYSSLDLGSVVNLQTAKLGYSSGKLFTVTGVNLDYQANTIDLTLWG